MLKNLLNLIPTIIGMIQSVLPIAKELVVCVVRIIAILPFLWDKDDAIIAKVNEIYDVIYNWVEKIKNLFLLVK